MYVLDANVFINAHRDYYSFDLAPSFWAGLVYLAGKSQICSIDKIKSEILCPDHIDPDELHSWSASEFQAYFNKTNAHDVITSYTEIQRWANSNSQFTDAAKSEFASNADAWLIAYAKAKDCKLVTHEAYNPDTKRRILIPVVCVQFNIPYLNTFEMLRQLQVQL